MKIGFLIKRAKAVYKERGLQGLLMGIRNQIRDWIRKYYAVYYMYKRTLKKSNEADFLPRINNYSFEVVTTTGQLDELITAGYNFILDNANLNDMRRKIEKGCVAFFVFVGKELGNRVIVAMTEEAMSTFNRHPYKVDFANHEVCITDNWTNPNYRNMGLSAFRSVKHQIYLIEQGIKTQWSIIEANNAPSIRARNKTLSVEDQAPYAKVRYLKIFGKEFWKEKRLDKN